MKGSGNFQHGAADQLALAHACKDVVDVFQALEVDLRLDLATCGEGHRVVEILARADVGTGDRQLPTADAGNGSAHRVGIAAGRVGDVEPKGRLRVATKFVNVAKRYYAEQGRQVDIIKLYGSMELAPLIGLADKIIDVVDTGNTLRANGLEPQELIATISSRLVVNKASMKMQHARIQALIDTLRNAVESRHRG